jgi:hypothetical protein
VSGKFGPYTVRTYCLTGVRIEFTKSRARANCFTEEVELTTVEMGRILRFYSYKSQEWSARATESKSEGHRAFAHRQAAVYLSLRTRCITLWKDIPAYIARMQSIVDDPQLAVPGEFDRSTSARNRAFEGGR